MECSVLVRKEGQLWRGHRCLWVPAELPSVAAWGQELCEEKGGFAPSLPSPALGTISSWSQQGKKVWFSCRRSGWTFSLFTQHTPHRVFLKPSVLVPHSTTLSVTDCYDFTLTACKFLKYPVTQICQKSLLCQIYSHISSSRQQRCNCCCFINDGIRGSVT